MQDRNLQSISIFKVRFSHVNLWNRFSLKLKTNRDELHCVMICENGFDINDFERSISEHHFETIEN